MMLRGPVALVVLGVLAVATGCTQDDHHSSATTLAEGRRTDAAVTAALTGDRVSVMLPSGRANFIVTKPVTRVAAEQADGSHDLVAAAGDELVGIAWTLDLGAYPDYVNEQVAAPSDVMGAPRQVGVTLRTGEVSIPIPVGDMIATSDHPTRPSWVAIPRRSSMRLQVTYDGLTQTADPSTGSVDAGPAKRFGHSLPWSHGSPEYAVGYPYFKGGGWARGGRTWIVVEESATGITLDGVRGVAFHSSDDAERVTAFLVRPKDRMELRWRTKRGRIVRDWIDGTVSW